MFKEKDLSPEKIKSEEELTPEDEKFVEENPELGEIAMLEAGTTLIKTNEPEKIKQGIEVIEAAKAEILTPRKDDSKRASVLKVKGVAKEIFMVMTGMRENYDVKAFGEDIDEFVQKVKTAEKGEKIKALWKGSLEFSKKHGLLHMINDIKRAVKEKREK